MLGKRSLFTCSTLPSSNCCAVNTVEILTYFKSSFKIIMINASLFHTFLAHIAYLHITYSWKVLLEIPVQAPES